MTTWTNQTRTLNPVKLLIDDTFYLLIDSTNELLIEDFDSVTEWTYQTKN